MKTYEVEARLKFPSCYHSGYDFTVYAKNKAAAISSARKMAAREGHNGKIDGALIYTATEISC